MPFVYIGNILHFSSNNGVILLDGALSVCAEELKAAVETAFSHLNDDFLVDACCGASGLLPDRTEYTQYLRILQEHKVMTAGVLAKRYHTKKRRGYFNSKRSSFLLAMLEAGVPYVCSRDGCGIHDDLTLDHVVPLSRGGSDDPSNLRFLCRPHNSAKGDMFLVAARKVPDPPFRTLLLETDSPGLLPPGRLDVDRKPH